MIDDISCYGGARKPTDAVTVDDFKNARQKMPIRVHGPR
jgi:hypothetical protein